MKCTLAMELIDPASNSIDLIREITLPFMPQAGTTFEVGVDLITKASAANIVIGSEGASILVYLEPVKARADELLDDGWQII